MSKQDVYDFTDSNDPKNCYLDNFVLVLETSLFQELLEIKTVRYKIDSLSNVKCVRTPKIKTERYKMLNIPSSDTDWTERGCLHSTQGDTKLW